MTAIIARVPQIDWSKGFDRHWNGGNPAVTHIFNALSFLFPQGEKYFIDAAREVALHMDLSGNPELDVEVRSFVAQESIHTYQHIQYNAVLEQQGFENVVRRYIDRVVELSFRHLTSLSNLALVCAYEHFTAILGNFILSDPRVLESATSNMALIWGWHAAEETAHKAVCFDLYRAAGGGWLRRVLAFLMVLLNFSGLFCRVYFSLLYRDGCLRPSKFFGTLLQALRFFFGVSGIAWKLLGHGLCYFSPWFHPWNQNNRPKLQAWLDTNRRSLREV